MGCALVLVAAMGLSLPHAVSAQQAPVAEQVAEPLAGVNQLTQTAVQLGVLTCAARVQQVTSFLGVTPDTRASLRRPASPPDINSFSIAMMVQADGIPGLGTADFYPVQGGCKATYNLTLTYPQSCDDLRSSSFASLSEEPELSNSIRVLSGAPNLRVVLIDAGEECTAVKTETLE